MTGSRINAQETKDAFESFVQGQGITIADLTATSAVRTMADFYSTVEVTDVDLENDGDMLLFQWGTYDWGRGLHFEYDLTRQLITSEGTIRQLSLTLRFEPPKDTNELEPGNHWCHDKNNIARFLRFVESAPATNLADRLSPAVDLTWEEV